MPITLPASRSGRALLRAALCSLPLLTLAAAGCQRHATTAADQPVPVRLRTPAHLVQPRSLEVGGAVEANTTAQCAFQISGRVRRVLVEEGQHVVKGQLLAELDPADYQNAAEAASAQAAAAEAVAAKAQNGPRSQELEQARIDFERTSDEYARMKLLFDRKSLSANDFHKYEAAYLAARERYDMARQGSRSEDKSSAQAQARAARAQAAEARKRLGDTRLLAPLSGYIGFKRIEAGDTVASGAPVLSVLDLDPVKVRTGAPEAQIGLVHLGGRASVAIPSLGKSFEGKVEAVGVAADPASRTYTVKIAVPNPTRELRAGLVATARIFSDQSEDVLTAPGEAIVRDPQGVLHVYVYDATRQRVFARRVEVGQAIGREIVLRSGVAKSDQIVVSGQQNVQEGALVKIVGEQR